MVNIKSHIGVEEFLGQESNAQSFHRHRYRCDRGDVGGVRRTMPVASRIAPGGTVTS